MQVKVNERQTNFASRQVQSLEIKSYERENKLSEIKHEFISTRYCTMKQIKALCQIAHEAIFNANKLIEWETCV